MQFNISIKSRIIDAIIELFLTRFLINVNFYKNVKTLKNI